MRLIFLILFSTVFSSYINSFEINDQNSWYTNPMNSRSSWYQCKPNCMSYKEYMQEIKNLKPLSDSKNAKEIRAFRVKWYTLHGAESLRSYFGKVCLKRMGAPEWCFGEDYYSSEEAKAILNALLLLDEMKEKYGANDFVALAEHARSYGNYELYEFWGDSTSDYLRSLKENDRSFLLKAFNSNSLTPDEWDYLVTLGIPSALALKDSETIDIGFKGQVEVFSQEYNDRIEKRLADIDKETGGLLSSFSDMSLFADYPEIAAEENISIGRPSIETRFLKICEDIFDDNQVRWSNKLKSGYAKKLDFCDWNTIYPFITGIYSIESDELKNYDPDIYFNDFYLQYFPTNFKVDNVEHEFYFGIGPEILFNAKYGESAGLDIVKKLIDLSTKIRNDFYKDVRSLEDIKDRALIWGKSSSAPGFKKVVNPKTDKEKRILESFENYITTDEYRKSILAAEAEENINKLLKDQVVKRLIDLKTSMEYVDLCYESRVGYAAIFISQNEHRALTSKFNENFNKTALELDQEIKRKIDVYGLDLFIENNVYVDSSLLEVALRTGTWTPELNEVCTFHQFKLEGYDFFD